MSNNSTFLDAEDDEQRQKRIGALLERLNTTSPSSSVSPRPLLNIERERSPGQVGPPVELLERVQAFLSAISTSNEALSQQKPEDIDIENVPEDEEQYIEMDLGLGVFEAKPRPKSRSPTPPSTEVESTSDATSSESESDSDSSSSSSEEDPDSDSSSSDDSDESGAESHTDSSEIDMKPVSTRPIKPLPRRVLQKERHEV